MKTKRKNKQEKNKNTKKVLEISTSNEYKTKSSHSTGHRGKEFSANGPNLG
jgi:hypothetical protein